MIDKSRKTFSLLLLIVLIVSTSIFLLPEVSRNIGRTLIQLGISMVSGTQPRIYLHPKDTIDTNLNPGDNFTVDIKVEDVTDLAAWEVGIFFDPGVLNFSSFEEGPFLKGGGETFSWTYEEHDNSVLCFSSFTRLSSSSPVSGSGILASVTFRVKGIGLSELDMDNDDTFLLDSYTEKIDISIENGFFSNSETIPTTTSEPSELPQWSNLKNVPEVVTASNSVVISVEWSDNVGLKMVMISENSTGEWVDHIVYGG